MNYIAQGNQIVDKKLVVLFIYEGEMIELGHPHFTTPDDDLADLTMIINDY